jgi:hypothetical protein
LRWLEDGILLRWGSLVAAQGCRTWLNHLYLGQQGCFRTPVTSHGRSQFGTASAKRHFWEFVWGGAHYSCFARMVWHSVHIKALLQKRSKKANLGDANSMYYSEKACPTPAGCTALSGLTSLCPPVQLKRWVERGKEDEYESADASPPPPPKSFASFTTSRPPSTNSLDGQEGGLNAGHLR